MNRMGRILVAVAFCGLTLPAFAAPAPVYDAEAAQYEDQSNRDAVEVSSVPIAQEDEAADQVAQTPPQTSLTVDQRVLRLERQMTQLQSGEFSSRLQSLQAEVQSLRAQLEELNHQIVVLKQNALKARSPEILTNSSPVKSPSNSTVPTPTAKSTVGVSKGGHQPDAAEEQKIYQQAYLHIKNKKYTEAITTLEAMIKKYPTGQFAANAHYWLGELYGLLSKNTQAIFEFNKVISDYPQSSRIADAQLKIALINASDFKWGEAKKGFKLIINRYPGTASARLASEQLKQISAAGH